MPDPFPHKAVMNPGNGRELHMSPGVEAIPFSVTLAEVIAGTTIVPKIPGFTAKVLDFLLIFSGNAATATDIRLSSTASTPVDIATVLIANAQNGDKLSAADAEAVLGAGHLAELAEGEGVLIRETGTTLTGTTGVTGYVLVQWTNN